jgi:hypothetical protein
MLITLAIICLINVLLMAYLRGDILLYVIICANPLLLVVTFPLSIIFELVYVKEFVNSGMEFQIENQTYISNRDEKTAYYCIFGIFIFLIIHVITVLYPLSIKPHFYFVIMAPMAWFRLLGSKGVDSRSYKQKWIEDFSGISKIGIITLLLILIYGSIILFLSIDAKDLLFQYYGMLIYEIFWIFIFSIGAFSSWYRKQGIEVTKELLDSREE